MYSHAYHFKMQMRAGAATGAAHFSKHVGGSHHIAGFDVDGSKMSVSGLQSSVMFNQNRFAVTAGIIAHRDHPAR